MKYVDKLKKYGKKFISKEELEGIFSTSSDEELYEIIRQVSNEHLLLPVKNSKTNGNRKYPICLKYRVLLPGETYLDEVKEISNLHPLLLKNSYLQSKPEEYKKYRVLFQKLDRYLFLRQENDVSISRKERSFEIFDEEKVLDDKVFCSLLDRLGLTSNVLGFYDTPEYCFNDYIPIRKSKMTLLICENKDIWFNMRRMMFEHRASSIFNTQIDGIVYGCGNKICGMKALTSYTEFIGAKVEYLYWGDIDRAGLNIFLGAVRNNPQLNIQIFVPAYEEMLRLAQSRNIPNSNDERNLMDDYSTIFNSINQDLRVAFKKSIEENKRIPQEIITYAFLKENMR